MGFKDNMTVWLKETKDKINAELDNYKEIGKNPLDVLYDKSKLSGSIGCISEVLSDIEKFEDNDSICSIGVTVNLDKRLHQKVDERKAIKDADDHEAYIQKLSEINGHISILNDAMGVAKYYTSISARSLITGDQ